MGERKKENEEIEFEKIPRRKQIGAGADSWREEFSAEENLERNERERFGSRRE